MYAFLLTFADKRSCDQREQFGKFASRANFRLFAVIRGEEKSDEIAASPRILEDNPQHTKQVAGITSI